MPTNDLNDLSKQIVSELSESLEAFHFCTITKLQNKLKIDGF